MSEIKNAGWMWLALNTFKYNYLTPVLFKGLNIIVAMSSMFMKLNIYAK